MARESQDSSEPEHSRIGCVVKLDKETSSTLRKGQVVTKISDIVRELVDNSVDAKASSIQILLENFGLDKIEVRDTGQGIASSEFRNAVAGGYTSKLKTPDHPSCNKYYGFRGEALSAICSIADVCITTKTIDDLQATKFVLDKDGQVVSENKVASPNGTIVVVEKLFAKYPVRRQWLQQKNKGPAELKEIETYLKAIAIANPKTHVSLYHKSSLVWSKASVNSIEQALITVLGHSLSKNLAKCGPFTIDVSEEDEKKKRTLEAFVLKKPIDMRTMSFTSNKLTMIFVNRKRVYIHDLEKVIQRYTAAVVEKPAPADKRRFPVSVINITLPANEVDFNLDMDKSKVLLVHKKEILEKLEEILSNFYGVNLNELEQAENTVSPHAAATTSPELQNLKELQICNDNNLLSTSVCVSANNEVRIVEESPRKMIAQVIPRSPIAEPAQRKETIHAFLDNIPRVSLSNFNQSPSPVKNVSINDGNHKHAATISINNILPSNSSIPDNHEVSKGHVDVTTFRNDVKSNFDLNLDDFLDMETQEFNQLGIGANKNKSSEPESSSSVLNNWVHGRMTDANGEIIQSVVLARPASAVTPKSSSNEINQSFESVFKTPSNENLSTPQNAFSQIGSGFNNTKTSSSDPPVAKRPRLSENWFSQTSVAKSPDVFSSSRLSVSLTSTPRQVTLDSYKDWQGSRQRLASSILASPVGVRFPLSQSTPKKNVSTPKTLPNYWKNNNSSLVGLRQSATLENSIRKTYTPNSFQYNSCSKLIGPIQGSNFYTARVNNILGVFSPLSMLNCYPNLKYDLKITLDKVTSSGQEINAEYIVNKQCVPKLFNEFLRTVDQTSENFHKIFHVLQDLNNIQGCFTGAFPCFTVSEA